ncbi:MAG: hypothetical protein E7599_04900 [Ruminococcaceae bacterium]|nr:hypothetical protein [Oscillospiraceae bacterium]
MKKLLSIVLSVLLILPIVTSFGLGTAAESTYEQLWAEKVAYEKDRGVTDGTSEGHWNLFYGFDCNFVLYTEKAKNLTFEVSWEDCELGEFVLAYLGDMNFLLCNEMYEVFSSTFKDNENGESCGPGPVYSFVRKAVKALGLTREEVLSAYDKMENEPESVRGILSFLSDEQFAEYISYVKTIGKPTNFMFEAAFLEDDAEGESLLCKTGTVYFPELGYSLATTRLVGDDRSVDFPIEMFLKFDLTSDEFGYYLANLRRYLSPNSYDWIDYEEGDSPVDRLERLEAAREAQLAAAETGDNAVTALWVVALALPALAVVTLKRKRKI